MSCTSVLFHRPSTGSTVSRPEVAGSTTPLLPTAGSAVCLLPIIPCSGEAIVGFSSCTRIGTIETTRNWVTTYTATFTYQASVWIANFQMDINYSVDGFRRVRFKITGTRPNTGYIVSNFRYYNEVQDMYLDPINEANANQSVNFTGDEREMAVGSTMTCKEHHNLVFGNPNIISSLVTWADWIVEGDACTSGDSQTAINNVSGSNSTQVIVTMTITCSNLTTGSTYLVRVGEIVTDIGGGNAITDDFMLTFVATGPTKTIVEVVTAASQKQITLGAVTLEQI